MRGIGWERNGLGGEIIWIRRETPSDLLCPQRRHLSTGEVNETKEAGVRERLGRGTLGCMWQDGNCYREREQPNSREEFGVPVSYDTEVEEGLADEDFEKRQGKARSRTSIGEVAGSRNGIPSSSNISGKTGQAEIAIPSRELSG
ncbi:unnamed protein product [Linum trigynum]|uniref:Uncharacterized protein n=1 Tax=Linum trigynum TaxID=586398 RepID=A0AAV2FAH2_9ROSI